MNQKVLKTHLEAELLFSICQFIVQLGAVDGVDDSSDQVNAGAEVVIALLDHRNMRTHLNDLLVNRLIVEELNALVVNIGVCTLQNRGDNAAVTQGVIIGLGAAAEGVCEEGFCQINIAAVLPQLAVMYRPQPPLEA